MLHPAVWASQHMTPLPKQSEIVEEIIDHLLPLIRAWRFDGECDGPAVDAAGKRLCRFPRSQSKICHSRIPEAARPRNAQAFAGANSQTSGQPRRVWIRPSSRNRYERARDRWLGISSSRWKARPRSLSEYSRSSIPTRIRFRESRHQESNFPLRVSKRTQLRILFRGARRFANTRTGS